MSKNLVAGIDPGSKTGLVILNGEHPVSHREIRAPGGDAVIRAGSIAWQISKEMELAEDMLDGRIELVAIEGYAYQNHHSLVPLVTTGAIIRYMLRQAGTPYIEVAPTSLKKFASGKGNSRKDMMRLEIFKRWKFEDDSDNVVDAYGLARIAQALALGDSTLNKSQKEVLEKLKPQLDLISAGLAGKT